MHINFLHPRKSIFLSFSFARFISGMDIAHTHTPWRFLHPYPIPIGGKFSFVVVVDRRCVGKFTNVVTLPINKVVVMVWWRCSVVVVLHWLLSKCCLLFSIFFLCSFNSRHSNSAGWQSCLI